MLSFSEQHLQYDQRHMFSLIFRTENGRFTTGREGGRNFLRERENERKNERNKKISEDLLHCFGNLCLIVASQNSKFGNLSPLAKLADWRNIFSTQSLKLQMMAANTYSWHSWDETKRKEILEMENDILQLLRGYLN